MEIETKRDYLFHHNVTGRLQKNLRLNYEQLSWEVIKQVRGKMSQRKLSEKLNFSFNQVGKWESGATLIKWKEFMELCQALEIPLETFFCYFFGHQDLIFDERTTLKTLVTKLNLSSSQEPPMRTLARKWLSGTHHPSFSQVLSVMGIKSPVLFGWLSQIVDCHQISCIKESYHLFLQNMEAVLETPLVVFVNAALQIESYQKLEFHDEKLLAEHAACSVSELKQALNVMLKFDLIYFDGRKYIPSVFDFGFSSLRHPKIRGLTKWATCLAATRYPDKPITMDPQRVRNPSRSSVRVTAMSASAAQKISDLIVSFHNQIDEIVNRDREPKDNVQVLLIHSFASNINSSE